MDYEKDADIIYASFMHAYGIDLFKERGRLPWWKFVALFHALPENTKIREVIKIRQMDMPAATSRNQKEIQALAELKQYYALPGVGGGGYETGLRKLWAALEKQAVKQ